MVRWPARARPGARPAGPLRPWVPSFGTPTEADLELLRAGLADDGRSVDEIEMVGGTRATFAGDDSCADLGAAMAPIVEQLEHGFTTFCVKPSQFIDSADELQGFLRDVTRRAQALSG